MRLLMAAAVVVRKTHQCRTAAELDSKFLQVNRLLGLGAAVAHERVVVANANMGGQFAAALRIKRARRMGRHALLLPTFQRMCDVRRWE